MRSFCITSYGELTLGLDIFILHMLLQKYIPYMCPEVLVLSQPVKTVNQIVR